MELIVVYKSAHNYTILTGPLAKVEQIQEHSEQN